MKEPDPNSKDFQVLKYDCERDAQLRGILDNYKTQLYCWANIAKGQFTLRDIDREFKFSVDQLHTRLTALEELVTDGFLKKPNKKMGVYALPNKELIEMDFSEMCQPVPIWLPFGIHKFVHLFPGNIIQINGEKNSGKTALMLNIIMNNSYIFDVKYFNSEMSGAEFKERLKPTDIDVNNLPFQAFERASDFDSVLFPGKDTINIIDFLECHEDFFLMGKMMRDIHDNLKESIAVVCVQLNKGAELGLGGGRTEEKSRLTLNIRPGELEIKMAKNWATSENPNGKCIKFKLHSGYHFLPEGGWFFKQ